MQICQSALHAPHCCTDRRLDKNIAKSSMRMQFLSLGVCRPNLCAAGGKNRTWHLLQKKIEATEHYRNARLPDHRGRRGPRLVASSTTLDSRVCPQTSLWTIRTSPTSACARALIRANNAPVVIMLPLVREKYHPRGSDSFCRGSLNFDEGAYPAFDPPGTQSCSSARVAPRPVEARLCYDGG